MIIIYHRYGRYDNLYNFYGTRALYPPEIKRVFPFPFSWKYYNIFQAKAEQEAAEAKAKAEAEAKVYNLARFRPAFIECSLFQCILSSFITFKAKAEQEVAEAKAKAEAEAKVCA